MKYFKTSIIVIFTYLFFLTLSQDIHASSGGLAVPSSAVSVFSITSVGEFVGAVLSLIFLVAGVAFALLFLYGAFSAATSGGDKAGMQAATGKITAAFVGLGIIAVAWAITLLMQTFFGINITNIGLPTPY